MGELSWTGADVLPLTNALIEVIIPIKVDEPEKCPAGCGTQLVPEWNTIGTNIYMSESRICVRTLVFTCPSCHIYPERSLGPGMLDQITNGLKKLMEDHRVEILISRN
jgi:hypothetical protein